MKSYFFLISLNDDDHDGEVGHILAKDKRKANNILWRTFPEYENRRVLFEDKIHRLGYDQWLIDGISAMKIKVSKTIPVGKF